MKTYLVGGAVRDKLLGYQPHEHDWVVVGASPLDLERLGFQQVGKDFPVFLHPKTQEEYALARTERKAGKGYKGFTVDADTSVTLEQDLSRRDLTINAIAEDDNGNLIDPYNGQQDIQNRLLRHVSDAFVEDPLRVLRIARFLARFAHLGFQVAADTQRLLEQMVASRELEHLTPERVWKEWEKSLTTESPEKFLELLLQLKACPQVLPGLQIDQRTIALLRLVAEHSDCPELRFASLFIVQAASCDITSFCRQLAIPNRYKEAAQLAFTQRELLLQDDRLKPTDYVELINAMDYWRRPERLQQWLTLRSALHGTEDSSARVPLAAQAAAQVSARDLLQLGYEGKALGEALAKKRNEVLLEQLKG